jgi:hypothetical protein
MFYAIVLRLTQCRYGELFPLVEKIGSGIAKADGTTSVITANVVKHCVWLLQRPQVADIAVTLSSNLLSGRPKYRQFWFFIPQTCF